MSKEIDRFMDYLSKWNSQLTGDAHDYLTSLVIISREIGPVNGVMKAVNVSADLTPEDVEKYLRERLEYLVKKEKISPSLLVHGLSLKFLKWLELNFEGTRRIHVCEKMIAEKKGDSHFAQKQLAKIKTIEYKLAAVAEASCWREIARKDLQKI